LFDFKIAGEDRAGEGDGDDVAGVAIGRAAYDGFNAAGGADVDGADGEFVGVGVFGAGEDASGDDVVEPGRAGVVNGFDFEAEECDGAGEFSGGYAGEVDVVVEPGEGEFHECGARVGGWCLKVARVAVVFILDFRFSIFDWELPLQADFGAAR
jgi:hypothetical protein